MQIELTITTNNTKLVNVAQSYGIRSAVLEFLNVKHEHIGSAVAEYLEQFTPIYLDLAAENNCKQCYKEMLQYLKKSEFVPGNINEFGTKYFTIKFRTL